MVSKVRLLPRSTLWTLIVGSSTIFAIAWIGCFPCRSTAAFTTEPPTSLQMGGVSLQPPAKSRRTGEAAQTACNQYAGVAESGGGLRGGAEKPGVLAKTRQARLSVARRKFGLARQREQCELSGELPSGARAVSYTHLRAHET